MMRILHTADWHLNDVLGRIPLQPHLVQRLEEIAGYLDSEHIDVMVIAGDIFSHYTRLSELETAVADINRIFKPFLLSGGTIVGISGNHDNEHVMKLFRSAIDLGYPIDQALSGPRPLGRFYLANDPGFLLLEDRSHSGDCVQFALLPYPTFARYKGEQNIYKRIEEKNRILAEKVKDKLQQIETQKINPSLPSVLVAHLHLRGSALHSLFRIEESQDIVFDPKDIPTHWAYVACGHIHQAQILANTEHVRYSGSIDRLDLGESSDTKGVVVVEIGPSGRVGRIDELPLNATPIYKVQVTDPDAELETLADRYPDHMRALVKYEVFYSPGEHNREAIRQEIERIFPHWYDGDVKPVGRALSAITLYESPNLQNVSNTVKTYLSQLLQNDPDHEELLERAMRLVTDMEGEEPL